MIVVFFSELFNLVHLLINNSRSIVLCYVEQVEHNEPVRGHPIGRAHTFFNINFINVVGLSHFLTSFKNKCKPQTNLKDKCLQVCQLILASLCRPFFLSAWVTLRCLLLIEKGEIIKHVQKDCTNTLALNAQSLISENSLQILINRANTICCPIGILLKKSPDTQCYMVLYFSIL